MSKAINKSKRKQLSNPFSTGGGGTHFEAHVQAAFAVLMLTGGIAPCLPPWPIKKIKLQAKQAGFETDDLVVFVEEPVSARTARLLVQVKHNINLTKGDVVFGEVLQAAWTDFRNPKSFSEGVDSIALITGPLRCTDMEVRTILEWARHSEDAHDFLRKVNESNFSSKTKMEKLAILKNQLEAANDGSAPADDEIWGFLKNYHLLGYDLDIRAGVTHSLLHSLIGQYSPDNVASVWSRVVDEVQAANQNAGTITVEWFSEEVRKHFQRRQLETIPLALIQRVELTVTAPPVTAETRPQAFASELVTAVLLGGWNEAIDGDVKIASQLAGEDYAQWIRKVREVLQETESPLMLRNGTWTCTRKGETWQALGPRIFDSHLDVFQGAAVSVLSQRHPMFGLPAEKRYAAQVFQKGLTHSDTLRQGLAETLALLGSRPKALTNCSLNRPETIAVLAIRQIFRNADWVLWGSLDTLLPLLAEAAPGEFLDTVEAALINVPGPFDILFEQESSGITGANYMTGLLWALETLAWDADYLMRVVIILGDLAARDSGGNWANRPDNSLTTILLPWLPQTCATFEKRKAAVVTLLHELPDVAWRLLLSLLPAAHSISFRSHKPIWRESIPSDWSDVVQQEDYWKEVDAYAELAIHVARSDLSKLAELVERFNNLPPVAQEQLLVYLESAPVLSLPEIDRPRLSTAILDLVSKHRKSADARWAMTPDQMSRLASLAKLLEPTSPALRHQRLFGERDVRLYEEKGDYENQRKQLEQRRQRAVEEVAATGGLQSVLAFAESVQTPWRVGSAFGLIAANDADSGVLPCLLNEQQNSLAQFARGFVTGRFRSRGWSWVDAIDTSQWVPEQIARLLCNLPFVPDTWARSTRLLGENEASYWTKVDVNPYEPSAGLEVAIEHLLRNGRPYAAIRCLHTMHLDNRPFNAATAVRALLAGLDSTEGTHSMDEYEIVDIIKALQDDPSTNMDDLYEVEWEYLPLLDEPQGASPKLLDRRLANDPTYFCEVIRLAFRSRKEERPTQEPTEQRRNTAANAYRLLTNWRTPPGCRDDGGYDADALDRWLQAVKKECTETGHLEVALTFVGHVLMYGPADPDGLWIHRSASAALNAKDAGKMRDGFRSELFNSRGVHWVDPTGKPERELAERYRQRAELVENAGYQRLAATLRDLADSYDREAGRIVLEEQEGDR